MFFFLEKNGEPAHSKATAQWRDPIGSDGGDRRNQLMRGAPSSAAVLCEHLRYWGGGGGVIGERMTTTRGRREWQTGA